MVQLQLSFSSITELEAFLAARSAQPAKTDDELSGTEPATFVTSAMPEVVSKPAAPQTRGRPAKTQATVVAPSANATTATDNGASVQPATPPEAGATGGESEKQLPLAGVDPAPPAPTAATATETEMKDAAKAVIAKLGQIEGMNKAREVLERVAGVKLIRDVPADKYGAVKAAMDGLLA